MPDHDTGGSAAERIGNVTRRGATWEFLINGRDRLSSAIVIALVCGIALAAVIGAAAVADGGDEGMVWAVVLLVLALAGIFGVVVLLRRGVFARYAFRIDRAQGTVTALDRRERRVLWSEAFDPARLYLSRAYIRIGNASKEVAALVYGDPPQDHVEDEGPLPHKTVLTVGPRRALETIEQRLREE